MTPSSVTLPSAPITIIIIKNCRNWVLEKFANNFLFRDTLTHTLKVPFLVPRPTRQLLSMNQTGDLVCQI